MKSLLILLLIVLTAVAAIPPKPQYQSLVVTNVTVIDITNGQLKPDQTVEIGNNRIVRISKSSEVFTASNSEIIDGSGKFLIPGVRRINAVILDGQYFSKVHGRLSREVQLQAVQGGFSASRLAPIALQIADK